MKILVALIFLCFGHSIFCQKKEVSSKVTRILFILDASGSMIEKWEGKTRMEVAKETLTGLMDSLKKQSKVEIALRVYGHQFDKKLNNCKDTKLEVPFKNNNHEEIKQKLSKIKPKGTTLISYTLEQCAKDFPYQPNSRNIVILLTDGIESCGGDPCKLSHELSKKKIFLKPFIIGMGANIDFSKAFNCMGTYYDAQSVTNFKSTLQSIVKQSITPTFVKINLLDEDNKPIETNVNLTFINTFTEEAEIELVHYLDEKGNPDAIRIDPILSYQIIVNTIPKVIKNNVQIESGANNIINIKCPQGTLSIRNDYKEYKNLQALIRLAGKPEIIHIQKTGLKEKYLTGNYDIELLTLPRIKLYNTKITQHTTKEINIPGPGWFNIAEHHQGYGSIYLIKNNGQQEWVTNLENESSKCSILLQPGQYKLVFRSAQSKGSEYTIVKKFKIETGLSTQIKLY